MCGIAGWLGNLPDGENYAARIALALRHRGPDATGIRSWADATLVHTRLSIIDLSPTGAQPMANEDGTIWTVFNGEIYNHKELRRTLESHGHVFRGRADTEILPHLYEEEGSSFVAKLRGMFALAIYDARKRRLVLARDRFGIKPLFYAAGSERLAFASEITALHQLPDIDRRPDRQAIYDFAALSYIPAPETFYKGIRAVEPGDILEAKLEAGRVSWRASYYHQWVIAPDPTLSLPKAVNRTEELITTAVQRQMESDVPLGSLLSGGIDSSLVSAAAQAALSEQLRTFNVRFPEKDYDETWAATSVANHIGSRHETLDMDSAPGTWERVTGLLLHAGQPYADTSLFAAQRVCNLMHRQVTVALSGDGGDEGFGGYSYYWQIGRIARWQTIPAVARFAAALAVSPLARLGLFPAGLPQRMRELSTADDTSILQSLFCWIREEDHKHLCHDTGLLPVRRLFEPQWEYHLPSGGSRLERLSARATEIGVRLTLANDFLFKVDTASMKESLEVRVPMLDEDLFTFGLSLPHSLKVSGRKCKRVLREVGRRKLPAPVANKAKAGFAIPVDTWVDEDFKTKLRDILLGPSTKLAEFFRPDAYQPIIEAFCANHPCPGISRQGLYQRTIMFLALHLALTRN